MAIAVTPDQVALLRAQLLRTRAGRLAAEAGTFDSDFAEHLASLSVKKLPWRETEAMGKVSYMARNAPVASTLVPPAEQGMPAHTPANVSRWRVRIHNGHPRGRGAAYISDGRPRERGEAHLDDDLIE